MTDILNIIEQREKEAREVKESGILDRINEKPQLSEDDQPVKIDGFSFNVAWHYEGENRKQAEEKFNNLRPDSETGYKIDYSKMK